MITSKTLHKNTATEDGKDFHFLREVGIAHIEKLGSSLWTDYNAHDPGITVLEMLAYAITDLTQRIHMPIENLVATEKDNLANMHEQFLSAISVLPTKPVTALDYRNLFVHIKGVKNAWVQPYAQQVHVNCDTHPATLSYTPFEEIDKTRNPFTINGLNQIILDLEEAVEDETAIIEKVKKQYHQNRNFCEDLVSVSIVKEQPIGICAYIDLLPGTDEEFVLAQIYQAIDQYFSPSVYFYTLEQMYARGHTTDEIFEGPVPFEGACTNMTNSKGGFTDKEELAAADLRTEIRLSDLIQIIMNIEGVNVVKDISIGGCDGTLSLETVGWNICVEPGHKPVRCDKSIFNFTKGLLPIGINETKLAAYEAQLREEETAKQEAVITEDVPMPLGTYSSPESYTTIQNDFPDTYGITNIGIPGKVNKEREAKVKQLKAYLLFFDQVLANYFKHLSKAKDLLSVDEQMKRLYIENVVNYTTDNWDIEKQTHYSQEVEDLSGIGNLVDESGYSGNLINLMNNINGDGTEDTVFFNRRNMLLDHLLARFAERFSEYTFIMKTLYGDSKTTNHEILRAKVGFLNNYKQIGCTRGTGYNYCHPPTTGTDNGIWDTHNISGVQKRIALLLGIPNCTRRDLASEHLEVYDEKDKVDDGLIEYRWRIKTDKKVLLSSSKHYHHLSDAYKELYLAYHLGKNPDNYEIKQTKSKSRFYFNLINPDITDAKSEARIISRRIAYKASKEKSEEERDALISLLKEISQDEGMYMIEHILLRPDTHNTEQFNTEEAVLPDAPAAQFMTPCLDSDCSSCLEVDPYSFRVSIVLPGWTKRFGNVDFRRYAEQLIRQELPAHVLAKICWIGHPHDLVPENENDMAVLQQAYRSYLELMPCAKAPKSKTALAKKRKARKDLLQAMNKLNTIYSAGRLHDCDNDDTEENGKKIILGRTTIGNL